MIYIITDQYFESYAQDITKASKEECLKYFKDIDIIGVDTETKGFDPFTKSLLTLQLGDEKNQFVIDISTIDIKEFKELLETKIIILHNGKFDLRFLYHYGIIPHNNIFDTYLAERTISLGIDSHRKSLGACVERHLKITLKKEVRGLIHRLGIFNERVIRYSADDVKYLIPLKQSQEAILREYDLETSMALDNQFVSVLAYVEYCGIKLDREGWLKKSKEDKKVLDEKKAQLDKFVVDNFKNPKYVDPPNLFDDRFSCKINWNSTKQVVPLFEGLGINCTVFEKGESKQSLESSHLETQRDVHPIVPLFLEFKKAGKLVSTYGKDFLKHLNPKTGRIHTNFTQIRNTGRLASGKDKESDEIKPGEVNMQNIPSGRERTYFIPEKGNKFVVSDYSGQENHVLAHFAQDEDFTNSIGDLHSILASIIFPELSELSTKEIKKNHPEKRQFSKAATFAIAYGGDGTTIAENLSLSQEEGERIYKEYMNRFPGLQEYFEKTKEQVLKDGYVLINPTSKRKSFVLNFQQYRAQKKQMNKFFWETYRYEKEQDSDLFHSELKPFVSKYFRKRGAIERMGLNFPIQGSSSDMSKIAGIYVYEWILKNNLWGIVKICIPLHDEWVLECPEYLTDKVSKVLETAMIDAAKVFCPTIPFKADAVISDHWAH